VAVAQLDGQGAGQLFEQLREQASGPLKVIGMNQFENTATNQLVHAIAQNVGGRGAGEVLNGSILVAQRDSVHAVFDQSTKPFLTGLQRRLRLLALSNVLYMGDEVQGHTFGVSYQGTGDSPPYYVPVLMRIPFRKSPALNPPK